MPSSRKGRWKLTVEWLVRVIMAYLLQARQQPDGMTAARLRPAQHLPKSHKRDAVCTSRCEGTQPHQKSRRKHTRPADFSEERSAPRRLISIRRLRRSAACWDISLDDRYVPPAFKMGSDAWITTSADNYIREQRHRAHKR